MVLRHTKKNIEKEKLALSTNLNRNTVRLEQEINYVASKWTLTIQLVGRASRASRKGITP